MPNEYALSMFGKPAHRSPDIDYGSTYMSTIGPYGGQMNYVMSDAPVELSKPSVPSSKATPENMGLTLSGNDSTYGIPNAGESIDNASGAGAGLSMAALGGANPYVLAATVGLGYLQQRAADARAKRQKEAEIIQNQASNEVNILGNLSNQYGRALLR